MKQIIKFAIGAVILSSSIIFKSIYCRNPLIGDATRIWKQLKSDLELRNVSLMLTTADNPLFKASTLDNSYWESIGIKYVGDLNINGSFASFKELVEKYNLRNSDFFRFLQVRDFVKTHLEHYSTAGPDKLDNCLGKIVKKEFLIYIIQFKVIRFPQLKPSNARGRQSQG